jgi:hypothetical protein
LFFISGLFKVVLSTTDVEKLVGTMNWEVYGRVLVCFVPLSICPLAPAYVWEGKKSLCGFETDILCVVSGYSFFACTFYAQS